MQIDGLCDKEWCVLVVIGPTHRGHHFSLSKGTFRDALFLCYGWNITNVSSKCACDVTFDVDHAKPCHKGGLPTLCHNEVWYITAEMIKKCAGLWVSGVEDKRSSLTYVLYLRVREVERGVSSHPQVGWCVNVPPFFKRLAVYDLLSVKKQLPYSEVLCWIRCRLSFALLRSAIMAVHGSRYLKSTFYSNDTLIACTEVAVCNHDCVI